MRHGRGPARGWYWLAGALALAGVASAIAWFVLGFGRLNDSIEDLERVPIPGAATLELGEGRHTIYYERTEASPDSASDAPELDIRVAAVGAGEADLTTHLGNVTYSLDGRAGASLEGLRVSRAGSYRIEVAGEAPADARLAVGRGIGRGIFGLLLVTFALLLGPPAVGAAIALTVFLLRRSAARMPRPQG